MTAQHEAGAYEPRPGDRLTVRRYIQPTLSPGDPARQLTCQFSAVLVSSERLGSIGTRYYFDADTAVVDVPAGEPLDYGALRMVCDGYVFLKPDYLVTEVGPAQPGEAYRQQLTPDMAVVVDSSQCIVLEVTEPHGKLLRKVTVTHVDALKAALDAARGAQHTALAEADSRRVTGRFDRARAEGGLDRLQVMDYLAAKVRLNRVHAGTVVNRVRRNLTPETVRREADLQAYVVSYSGGYWHVTPVQPAAGV